MAGSSGLRICLVTGFRPTPGGGGTEKHVYELAQGLIARGADVEVICEDSSFLPDDRNPLGMRLLGVDPDSLHEPNWIPRYLEKSRRFAELLDPTRYDIVHCHSHYGFHVAHKLARLRERPALVSTFHLTPVGGLNRLRELGFPEPEGAPIDRAVAVMEEALASLSDGCIAVSRGVGREVVELYGVPQQRVKVIYNWFDRTVFWPRDPTVSRRRLGLDEGRPYLLYIGHFADLRGQILLDAMDTLPAEIGVIAVHPNTDRVLKERLRDRIIFPGYLPPEDLAMYYSAADLQCFPTVYGAFGLVLVEGMACGCPPIVFDYPAMNEIVTPASGYLVRRPTGAAYAEGILRALEDHGAKRAGAVERSRSFAMEPQIDRVLGFYQALTRRVVPGVIPDMVVERVDSAREQTVLRS